MSVSDLREDLEKVLMSMDAGRLVHCPELIRRALIRLNELEPPDIPGSFHPKIVPLKEPLRHPQGGYKTAASRADQPPQRPRRT